MRNSVNTTGDEYMDDPAADEPDALSDVPDDYGDDFYTHGDYFDDAYLAQFDDDPNPYHGDYSEM